jgi:hypothetical protein
MTAHVAAADEARGRVILRFGAWRPNDMAIRAALLVANAFHSEVEALFVEDSQRVDFAGFPFAREFSLRNGAQRHVTIEAVAAETRGSFRLARARIEAVAGDYEVSVYEHVVRDDPVQALVSACARRGPWNMIAIAETFGTPAPCSLDEVFETVTDATGVIIAGPAARLPRPPAPREPDAGQPSPAPAVAVGPVVLAVEDGDHLQAMVRAGGYLAAALETDIVVLLIAATEDELSTMDADVRIVLADSGDVRLARVGATFASQEAIAEAIRRLRGSFVIAQYGGVTAPPGKSLRPLTSALNCPLLLVR